MDVELEHVTQDLETNVTDDDVVVTANIARAHLNEFPDYCSRLAASACHIRRLVSYSGGSAPSSASAASKAARAER
jgi:hypothetical protein